MQILTTMKYHFTTVNVTITKKQNITNVVKDVGKREPYCSANGNVNWYKHYKKKYGDYLRN